MLGAFEGRDLRAHWRIETSTRRTSDELGILVRELFRFSAIDLARRVRAVVAASVVPPLQLSWRRWPTAISGAGPCSSAPA